MKKTTVLLAAVAGSLVTAGAATAQPIVTPILQWDINFTRGVASGSFSRDFTGTLTLSEDADTVLAGLFVDQVPVNGTGRNGVDFDVSATIEFTNGRISGGSLSLTDLVNGSVQNVYTAQLIASNVQAIAGGGNVPFAITGLTFEGMFSNPDGEFAGFDISPWGDAQAFLPLRGAISTFFFSPDANNADEDVDLDVSAFGIIPLPSAAGMGLAGMGLVALRRRRV